MVQGVSQRAWPISVFQKTAASAIVLLMILSISRASRAAEDHDVARRLRADGAIVSVSQILTTISRTRPGQALEIALQRRQGHVVYQVEWVDASGVVWYLRYNATSGALLSIQKDKSP
jgi:uncharacterized membrane protein YkoI